MKTEYDLPGKIMKSQSDLKISLGGSLIYSENSVILSKKNELSH
jgi:hypothetical protein